MRSCLAQGCLTFASTSFSLPQDLQQLSADLPPFSEPLLFGPEMGSLDPPGGLVKQDFPPEDPILDPSDVLAFSDLSQGMLLTAPPYFTTSKACMACNDVTA
jgi:hypothetical protein